MSDPIADWNGSITFQLELLQHPKQETVPTTDHQNGFNNMQSEGFRQDMIERLPISYDWKGYNYMFSHYL